MEKNTIDYNGYQYYESRRFEADSATYIEYRNDELQKIKYFELKDENIVEIRDRDMLKEVIKKNVNLFDGVID